MFSRTFWSFIGVNWDALYSVSPVVRALQFHFALSNPNPEQQLHCTVISQTGIPNSPSENEHFDQNQDNNAFIMYQGMCNFACDQTVYLLYLIMSSLGW